MTCAKANLAAVAFTLGDRVKEGVAESLTGVGGGSQNTLAAQLGGDPVLHVPKSTIGI